MQQLLYKLQNGRRTLIELDGSSALLYSGKVGFISSGIVFERLEEVLERWVKIVKREGKTIVSGFQSSVEKIVLRLALKEDVPIIVAEGTCLKERIPDELFEGFKGGKVAFISIFNDTIKTPSSATGYLRNKLVIDLCPEITVGAVRKKGTVDALIKENSDRTFLNLEDIIYNRC